ncbi:hypothetical protein M0R72_07800 [Candidatus Pacearchaeota archaeon]|jgi:hypothetical protein|nr:hypothetical protein [Candidatus Pacearchaeota archaeon]
MRLLKILLFLCAFSVPVFAGELLTIEAVGAASTDSLHINLTVTDTSFYPKVADPDTLYILRFSPTGTLVDSLYWNPTTKSANLFRLRTGVFSAHVRASNSSGTMGIYDVYSAVSLGTNGGSPERGVWRGHVVGSYSVTPSNPDSLRVLAEQLNYFSGSVNGSVKAYLPNDGTAYKNGYEIWVGGIKKYTIYFGHVNDPSVLDTTTTTKNY